MKIPKFETEYICQAIDSSGVVRSQAADRSEEKLVQWFKEKAHKGKFAGLECHVSKRLLINGRVFHVEQKHILWLLIVVQFLFITWTLVR